MSHGRTPGLRCSCFRQPGTYEAVHDRTTVLRVVSVWHLKQSRWRSYHGYRDATSLFLPQTYFGFWLTLNPNAARREEQHVQAWAPPPIPHPLPPEKWQAHLKPVSESSLARDWQETLARSHELPSESFLVEEMQAPPTQAHVTSAEDSLLTKWADSNHNHLTEDLQQHRWMLAPGTLHKMKDKHILNELRIIIQKYCLGKIQESYLKTKSTLLIHDFSCVTGSQCTTKKTWKLLRNSSKSSPADLGSVDYKPRIGATNIFLQCRTFEGDFQS